MELYVRIKYSRTMALICTRYLILHGRNMYVRDLKLFPSTRFLAYDISIGPKRFVVVIRIRHIPLKDLNNGDYKRERDREKER